MQSILTQHMKLKIIKARDPNGETFSAFVLEDPTKPSNIQVGNGLVDTSEWNIVYKMKGHDIDPKTKADVMKYLMQKYYVKVENKPENI